MRARHDLDGMWNRTAAKLISATAHDNVEPLDADGGRHDLLDDAGHLLPVILLHEKRLTSSRSESVWNVTFTGYARRSPLASDVPSPSGIDGGEE